MSVKRRITKLRKRIADYWAVKVVEWHLRLIVFMRRLRVWIGGVAVSVFGFAIAAAVLLNSSLRGIADAFQPLEAILSQLGATYGTILALVLTLSIIPIQRAAEVWSPSIVRLYRHDPATYVTFVSLGVFCAASFFLAVRGLIGMPVSLVLAFSLAVLGVSLDLLRWYHGHICRLLDPIYAVSQALKQVKQAIDQTKAFVTRISRFQHKLLNSEQQEELPVEVIQSTVYPHIPGYPNSINSWTNDLAEIAIKAVARGEKLLAKTAVFAVAELAIYYLSSRKHNLTLTPAPEAMFLALTSDVGVVTDRTHEALQEVSRAAVAQSDESTAIRVSEAYQAIAVHTANLGARAFRAHTAPLTYGSIYYALACVKYAQSKGLDDVVYQSASILSRVSLASTKDTAETDIHIPVLDGLFEISAYLYGKRSFALAEEVNGHHFSILALLLQRGDYYFEDVLRHVLEKMEALAPLALLSEVMAGHLSMVHPLGKAYGLVSQNSLGYLFDQAAATLPKVDVEREWANPYHDLVEIVDIIADHLRKIAENNEFGESSLIWELDHLIKHISIVIIRLIEHPLRPDNGDESDLIDKLHWVLAFYWVVFRGKKSVSKRRADECSDSLALIGLLFFAQGHPEVLRICVSNIRSILESYCETSQSPDHYTIGDLLAHLWGIRMVLIAKGNEVLTREVDQALTTKPRALTEEQWKAAQQAIELRREQLEEHLAERDDRMQRPDRAEAVLRRLLRETQG